MTITRSVQRRPKLVERCTHANYADSVHVVNSSWHVDGYGCVAAESPRHLVALCGCDDHWRLPRRADHPRSPHTKRLRSAAQLGPKASTAGRLGTWQLHHGSLHDLLVLHDLRVAQRE